MSKTITHKDILERLGWLPDLPDLRDTVYDPPRRLLRLRPTSVDLDGKITPVLDQLNLGCCVGNGTASSHMDSQLNQASPNPFLPSRLAIYYGARALEGSIPYDSGAYIRDAIKVLAKQGGAPETMWPYIISKFTKKPPVSYYREALKHQSIKYERVPQTIESIQSSLAEGITIVFGFSVYESFESSNVFRTGNVPMPKAGEKVLGGHCVRLIGFKNKTKRVKFRNSWGTSWGAKGDGTMPYDFILNPNIADDFWRVIIVED